MTGSNKHRGLAGRCRGLPGIYLILGGIYLSSGSDRSAEYRRPAGEPTRLLYLAPIPPIFPCSPFAHGVHRKSTTLYERCQPTSITSAGSLNKHVGQL
ncbi:hypothetical protein EJ06DRAFT_364762 [Trichodelitschia bisporula]|uniref:Uncharacterized protein n=1 Tax=Trichodelitschia bisporula TaxID=703511 RepID=A0A6G1I0S1_9PEZI|nr:hypothetical protein EJ06DRAFT_364762 [Trichodelitschia bisporula]